jgi:hypothetical protein
VAKPSPAVWASVLAWCAVEAMGSLRDASAPEAAATQLFDAMRLREPLAEAFADCGMEGDSHWRAAARLRASFAHPTDTTAAWKWIRDPDVAWAMGVHQFEGSAYLVKEHFERLLWWMSLRTLLDLSARQLPDPKPLTALQSEISTLLSRISAAGYRVEALEEAAPPVAANVHVPEPEGKP